MAAKKNASKKSAATGDVTAQGSTEQQGDVPASASATTGGVTVTLTEVCKVSPNGSAVLRFATGRQSMPKEHADMIRKAYPDRISAK